MTDRQARSAAYKFGIVSDGAATVRVEKLAQVGGRTFFLVSTERAAFKFYVTRQGLIRGLDYA
jgi:hypothetical protein